MPKTHPSGKSRKPVIRFLTQLTSGVPREMRMDFNAKAEIESLVVAGVKKLAAKLKRPPSAAEIAEHDFGMGPSAQIAWTAYCLTATWREDNGLADETFAQFKRLMPVDDESILAIKEAVDAVMGGLTAEDEETPVPMDAQGNSSEAPSSTMEPTGTA